VKIAAPTDSGFLDVDGVRLEFRRVAGAFTAPTLVLLHEGLGCVGMWKHFPERLAAATGCPVFLWSRQGFGRSDPIPLPRPLDYLERETPLVGRVLAETGIGRCVLVGHSDGGTIALLAAGAGGAPGIEGVATMAAHVFVEEVTVAGIRETQRAWEEGGLRSRLARWHGDNVEGAFRGWCDTWLDPGFRAWNIEKALPSVQVPVLAMQGADDQYGTPSQVDAIVRGVSGPARSMLIPGAGHAPHVDEPDAVIAAIRLFADALPCAAPTGPPT
jgi:pimeloyl-ACP methyl ester carboxylesterase